MSSFTGFTKEAPLFLEENNIRDDKEWFEKNRSQYDTILLTPFKNLVTALSQTMGTIDPLLDTKPAVGRTISRIFRDTRFSRNKSFFHSAMWITFKRREENWKNSPAFFFEICPDLWRFGMGYFAPSKETMDNYRTMIDEDTDGFIKMIEKTKGKFSFDVLGDEYKRPIKKDLDPRISGWYNRKSVYLSYSATDFSVLATARAANFLGEGFLQLAALYNFMRQASDKVSN